MAMNARTAAPGVCLCGLALQPKSSEPRDLACALQAAKNCQALGAPEVRTVVANLVLPKEVDKARGPACLGFIDTLLACFGY